MTDTASIKVLYFAKLAEDLACAEEDIQIARGSTLRDLLAHLSARGDKWRSLAAPEIRCAHNQNITRDNPELHTGDEIAFFPPVTGG